MSSYYHYFKKGQQNKSEQVVNTDHFGEKKEKKEFLFPWELKKKTNMTSYYHHFTSIILSSVKSPVYSEVFSHLLSVSVSNAYLSMV